MFNGLKGLVGESAVNFAAWLSLNKKTYKVYNNVTLPTENSTTQVDHIIVSKFGIFVVETKHMKGNFYGKEFDKTWTQKIGRRTYKFQNPLRQNYKHVKTIEALLEVPEEKLFSLIIFYSEGEMKTDVPDNVTSVVGGMRYIKSKRDVVFSEAELAVFNEKINNGRLTPSRETRKQHIQNVKQIIEEKKTLCPKCGSKMVLRTAKKGANAGEQFWGCSTFPKCRGTRKNNSPVPKP